MYRIGFGLLCGLLVACNGNEEKNDKPTAKENYHPAVSFDGQFTKASLPYQLTDTGLLKNNDTTTISPAALMPFVPDSIIQQSLGKTSSVKYSPLVKLEQKNKGNYYVIKATAGNKKTALLLAFDKGNNYGSALLFLAPDDNAETSQTSSVDKSFAITKTIVQRKGAETVGEGKEVVAFDTATKKFTLVMTDLLNDNPEVLVNPIDTFKKTNKLTGDYYLNKKNLIAVRDGRYPNQLLVYIHTENSERDCKGELKGEFILTSSKTAAYRQSGDPCVLGLTFSANSVTVNEQSGCGNYRGLDCPFTGTFSRKKEAKPKEIKKLKNK